ncbi:Ankyrin-3 [Beauveria bassiana D1-5]|uniref:Ankyrin-3 n=1 Tax=Beauveria bassiana D1-5 TaxID=1245745 RepID=A0A0A2V563_BEABA|nr:Ankyrin-3 [Beauveria bassiana D1-5]
MSLGFHISDFITFIELANRIRKDFIDAPSQFDRISSESLSIVLQDTEIVLSGCETDETQKAHLQEIACRCHKALLDLEKAVGKYSELKPAGQNIEEKVKRVWKRLQWEPQDVRDVRDQLTWNVSLLSASVEQLSSRTIFAAKRGIDYLAHQQENLERLAILDWLTKVDYAPLQSNLINQRQPGTGQWLLDAPEFQTWQSSEKGTLFCPGIPGAGKTMLTATVIDNLITHFTNDETIAVAYIYCDFRRTQEQRAEDLLASLLKQLAQVQPSLPDIVTLLYHEHLRKRTQASFDEISQALRSVTAMYQRVFIIVDALDECQITNGCRSKFVGEIFRLKAECPVSFFATSRFIPSITDRFEESASLEIRATAEDVRRYVRSRLSELPSFVERSSDLQEEVVAGIVKAVDGMFLLAKLHLESLIEKTNPKAMRAAIAKLPSGSDAYDKAYYSAMERIEGQLDGHQKLAKEVLSWLTCARRPLSITELQHALAVEFGEHEFDEENITQLEDMISVCGGLAEVDKSSGLIKIVHYTTQEFFERTHHRWFPDAESRNTRVCVTYLSYTVFASGFCHTDTDFEDRLHVNPFYNYAARNWGHHAREALSLHQEVYEFLRSYNLIESASQALMAARAWPGCSGFSQRVPRQLTGLHLAAHFGIEKAVETLIQHEADADARDDAGRTPLSWAAASGHETVVKLLMMIDYVEVNLQDNNGRTPLSWAAEFGQEAVVKMLLAIKDVIENSSLGLASSIACSSGTTDFAGLFPRKMVNATLADKAGRTPLHWASENGHVEVLKLLLEYRPPALPANRGATKKHAADVPSSLNMRDTTSKTPLHYAALHSWTNCVRLLLTRGAKITADMDNMTALHYAVSKSSKEMARCFLDAGISIHTGVQRRDWSEVDSEIKARCEPHNSSSSVVDCSSQHGLTALHYATLVGCEQMTDLFLAHGANPNVRSEYGETPLHLALKQDLYGPSWLNAPDRWNDPVYRIEAALDNIGYNPNDEDEYSNTRDLIEQRRLAVLTLLLNKGSTDVNAKDTYGASSLHCVKYESNKAPNIIKLLIESGADISAKNNQGQTALHLACSEPCLLSFIALVKQGADIAAVDLEGFNAVHYAAHTGNTKLVNVMAQKWPATLVAARDKRGRNALHHLTRESYHADEEAIKSLVSAGVSVKDLDDKGSSPLSLYLTTFLPLPPNAAGVVRLFLRCGSNSSFKTHFELSLAHLYAQSCESRVEVLQTLEEFGVDLAAKDCEGRTLLHYAAMAGSLTEQAFHFLRDKAGLDKNLQDRYGKTPLQYATEERRKERDPFIYDSDRWSRTEEILLRVPELS